MSIATPPPFYDFVYTQDNGTMTAESRFYNDQTAQLFNAIILQLNTGLQLPQQTDAQIVAQSTSSPNGTIWYNTTHDTVQILVAGAIKTVTVT